MYTFSVLRRMFAQSIQTMLIIFCCKFSFLKKKKKRKTKDESLLKGLYALLFFFFSVSSPSINKKMFKFQTTILKIVANFIGQLSSSRRGTGSHHLLFCNCSFLTYLLTSFLSFIFYLVQFCRFCQQFRGQKCKVTEKRWWRQR